MNDIVALATEEIIDVVLQGADCRHRDEGDAEYDLHPYHKKSTVQEVHRLVDKAIHDCLKKFMDEVERQGEVRP